MKNLPKPSQLNGNLTGSPLQKSELETIARNIRVIARTKHDTWTPFTWESYKEACTHDVTISEESALHQLVDMGYLKLVNESHFYFTPKIVGMYIMMSDWEAE